MKLLMNLLGRLPFPVLYLLSDIVFALIYHVVRYRRTLVARNIAGAFPEMTRSQHSGIGRRFYRNLCDYFFETAKLSSISDNEMRRRMVFTNPGMIDSLLDNHRSVAVYFSHCFNWEWAPSVTLWSNHSDNPSVRFCQVYRPLANKSADRWFLSVRSRFRSVSLPKRGVFRDLLRMRRPTEVISGTEVLAAKLDLAAVYWDITRISRGHYSITTHMLAEHPGQLPQGELTRRYISHLEATIRRDPSNWLWSHNRWKQVHHPTSR